MFLIMVLDTSLLGASPSSQAARAGGLRLHPFSLTHLAQSAQSRSAASWVPSAASWVPVVGGATGATALELWSFLGENPRPSGVRPSGQDPCGSERRSRGGFAMGFVMFGGRTTRVFAVLTYAGETLCLVRWNS